MPFKTELKTSPKGNKSVLKEQFIYYSPRIKGRIIVPKGFVTDFASVPRVFLPIIPKMGRHREAAVIHDYLYTGTRYKKLTRKDCDKLFLEAMIESKVPRWKRILMYRLVRIFGKSRFRVSQQEKGKGE